MNWKTRILKRLVDVSLASAGLAVTAPLFPVIAAAVKLTSKGPVLYRQVRCGAERRSGFDPRQVDLGTLGRAPATGTVGEVKRRRNGERRRERGARTFEMIKFRTMRVDAEAKSGAVLAQRNDPRLTPIGGFLRKTRLDELPQLMNILRGDMSIVGPRPERPELLAKMADSIPFFEERMRLIKPGLTGLAQINLNYDGSFDRNVKSNIDLEQFLGSIELPPPEAGDTGNGPPVVDAKSFANKLLFDLAYSAIVENPWECIKTDFEIIAKTPIVMIRAKGQ
jgi:lipopolysaccharide/colanic/teichoic acid biosynthesis glycosyltransferase